MAVKKNTTAEAVTVATDGAENTAAGISSSKAVKAENGEDTEEKTAAETGEVQPETVKLVYIGPSLPKAMLKTNRIFEGTEEAIKKELAPVIEKFPLVEKLLVPVKGLAEKKDRVRTAGNILNKYYSDIVSAASAAVEMEV